MSTEFQRLQDFDAGIKLPSFVRAKSASFVHAPVSWVRRAQESRGAFTVTCALLVWFRHSVTRERTFPVSNTAAAMFGLNRKQKTSGLLSLERAGMITVERAGGRSPLVTIQPEPGG